MSHSFSLAHVKQMEPHLDLNIRLLKDRIREHCARPGGAVFDLKRLLHFYVVDVLGELAFSQSFGVQESDDGSRVPPVIGIVPPRADQASAVTNFRITPVFTMPLACRVTAPEGIVIADQHIPQGTSIAVCNHAFHHNPSIWGSDHNTFNTHRWDDPALASKARYLMHFGLGARQCIGKSLATANISKLVSALLAEFRFELATSEEACAERMPGLVSVGISDLEGPLYVRAALR